MVVEESVLCYFNEMSNCQQILKNQRLNKFFYRFIRLGNRSVSMG